MSDSEDFKRGYREGWNDREDDLIAGIRRVLPPEGTLMSEVEKLVERLKEAAARTTWDQGDGADTWEVPHPDRALLSEAARRVEELEGALRQIEDMAPATQEVCLASMMADIARSVLSSSAAQVEDHE